MLDFYFSDQPCELESPIEELYCGSISSEGLNSIQSILEECDRRGCGIGFFTDVTLSQQQVADAALIFDRAAKHVPKNDVAQTAYQTILAMLQGAVARKTGIRGFAD